MSEIDIRNLISQAIDAYREQHSGKIPARVQVSVKHEDELQNMSTYYWNGSHAIQLEYTDGIDDVKGVRCIPHALFR